MGMSPLDSKFPSLVTDLYKSYQAVGALRKARHHNTV
jgi:hypothetical protein